MPKQCVGEYAAFDIAHLARQVDFGCARAFEATWRTTAGDWLIRAEILPHCGLRVDMRSAASRWTPI